MKFWPLLLLPFNQVSVIRPRCPGYELGDQTASSKALCGQDSAAEDFGLEPTRTVQWQGGAAGERAPVDTEDLPVVARLSLHGLGKVFFSFTPCIGLGITL